MITRETKKQLADYFATQPVDVVYLFGSQATGKANQLSDVDIGVLFKESVAKEKRFDLRLQFMSDVGSITGYPDQAEVIDLEQVPLVFKYAAIAPRQELYIRDRNRQVLFEADTLSRYFDYAYFLSSNTQLSLASIARM